ncbi:MAG: TIM barrel protein [Bryobacteraceae bacterium]|nr:TIM barrel protein [Bryobacteraceae bacterium]
MRSACGARFSRRGLMAAAGAGVLSASTGKVVKNARLNQSVCKWCYKDLTLDQLCEESAKMGIVAIDLLSAEEWPVLEKYGLICAMGGGICSIPDGLNVKANHAQIEANIRRLVPLAKKHKVPNLICFSGNRRKISDEEAWENCAVLLNRVKAQAEDVGVNIVMELLNSKVNHADYHCDKTTWGVELCKRVGSPRFKLLYDIYHMQIMEGDVIRTIRDNIDYIAHFHTGGNPGRHEIDETQELNYKAISKAIVDLKFDGYYAHEFIPTRDPLTSLREAVALCDV